MTRGEKERERGRWGGRGDSYNHTLTLARLACSFSRFKPSISLLPSHYLFAFLCTISVRRTEYYGANCEYRRILIKRASKGGIQSIIKGFGIEERMVEVWKSKRNCRYWDSFFNILPVLLITAGKITSTRNDECRIIYMNACHIICFIRVPCVLRICAIYIIFTIYSFLKLSGVQRRMNESWILYSKRIRDDKSAWRTLLRAEKCWKIVSNVIEHVALCLRQIKHANIIVPLAHHDRYEMHIDSASDRIVISLSLYLHFIRW